MRYLTLLLLLFTLLTVQSQVSFDTASALRNSKSIYSLVVSIKDSIVYAQSFNGKKEDELFNNQSLTKSIEAVLIGIAIDKGFIPSMDSKIVDFLPVLKDDPDKRKLNITIGDVMNQASGLWHEDLRRMDIYLKQNDPSGYVLKQPLNSDPGSELHYNNAASHILSVILTKATGQTTLAFAQQYLFEPLDIHKVEWPAMKDGYNDGSGLLSVRLNTVDVNKIGRLLLNNGRYKGQQVVSSNWVQALLNPSKLYPAPWGLTNTTYGLCFYHRTYQQEKMMFGMGWGGQYLILLPGLDAVISVNQEVNDRTAIRQSEIFMGKIFPVIVEWVKAKK